MNRAIVVFVAITAFTGTPALAADIALKAPSVPPQIYSWSGCYVGGSVGGSFARSSYSGNPTGDFRTPEPVGEPSIIPNLAAITAGALNPSSAIGGGEVGCNWQIHSIVIGHVSGWNLSKSLTATGPGDPEAPGTSLTVATSESSHWLATVRPRVGFAYNNWLFYASGGVAFTNITFSQSVLFSASNSAMAGSVTGTLTGWTAGAGVEYGITHNWLLKAEYLYVGFPSQSLTEINPAFPTFNANASNRLSTSIVRIGLDYKFGLPF